MKFILKGQEDQEKPTFGEVAKNQFFVCLQGTLCQKRDATRAYILTNRHGEPSTDGYSDWNAGTIISRILPTVVRIEY